MIRYQLPSIADLVRLGEPLPHAISIYLRTDPTPSGRAQAKTAAKSAVDAGIRQLRERGGSHAEQEAIRAHWDELAADSHLWGNLSSSLAIFLSPKISEEYVLPNHFVDATQVGTYFDLTQLVRAVSSGQEAYALTLSADGWKLWDVSADARASELPLTGEHPADAADANNRDTIRGRDHQRSIVGDEGRKTLLERYAQVVAGAVRSELGQVDQNASTPLFLLATEPLLSMFQNQDLPWQIVAIPGEPGALRPDQIDDAIRDQLSQVHAERVSTLADQIGNGFTDGLAVTDLAQLARSATTGAVSSMIYDFTRTTRGTLDDATGEIRYDDSGYDLLSRIAITVLKAGGEVLAVRPDEVRAEIWNGHVLAGLRFSTI